MKMVRESSGTFIEDTFREIQDDIFNTLGEPGKTIAWTASSILEQANHKACASRVQPALK